MDALVDKFQKLFLSINSEEVREYVERIRKKNAGLSKKELAKKIVHRKALKHGLLGAGTGAFGIVALPATIPVDTIKLLRAEGFLFKCINYVYGIDPDDDSVNYLFPILASTDSQEEFTHDIEDAFETFWGDSSTEEFIIKALKHSAFKAAIKQVPDIAAQFAVKQLGKSSANIFLKGMPKHLSKIFWRFGGRKFTEKAAAKTVGKAIPALGAFSGFLMDWGSVQKKGNLAIKFHEKGVISWACSLFTMNQPKLEKIAENQHSSDSLIFIHGYLTSDSNNLINHENWIAKLRTSGWGGSIYHCWWDSSNKTRMAVETLNDFLFNNKLPLQHFKKYRKMSALIGSHFILECLAKVIPNSSTVTFIGHSLGARSLFHVIKEWNRDLPQIKNIVLLGGAVDCTLEGWERCSYKVSGQLVNIINQNDGVLKRFYKLTHKEPPCGLSPITRNCQNIINLDGSQHIGETHLCHAYLDFFLSDLSKNFW